MFPQGVANYDPNSWSKVAGNTSPWKQKKTAARGSLYNSLHLISNHLYLKLGVLHHVAPVPKWPNWSQQRPNCSERPGAILHAASHHSLCTLWHVILDGRGNSPGDLEWSWPKPVNLRPITYDHLMIILWSAIIIIIIIIVIVIVIVIIIINNKHPLSIIIHILQTWSSQEMSTQHNKSCGKMFKV